MSQPKDIVNISETNNSLEIEKAYPTSLIKNMVEEVRNTSIITKEDGNFLAQNVENFSEILKNTYIWRTWGQKLSIISDDYHPTTHSKFHQVILESKVFFENMVRLSADGEKVKIELEELQLDLEESAERLSKLQLGSIAYRRELLLQEKFNIEIKMKLFSFEECKNAMVYRVKELKQWKEIQDQLYSKMIEEGMTEDQIWNKESPIAEIEDQFFMFLNNLKGLNNSTDGAEVNNLIALARHGVNQAQHAGIFSLLVKKCNEEQLAALNFLDNIARKKTK